MFRLNGLLLLLIVSAAFAQAPTWPPKLEANQVWNFVIEFSGQRYVWNVQLGSVLSNGAFAASADGLDKRSAQVSYIAETLPGTNYKNVLVFDFKAPSTPSSFGSAFTCIIQSDGKGSLVLAGAPCRASLGSTTIGSLGNVGAPIWLKEARREPTQGQTWGLETFNIVWSLSLIKAEADGFSGRAKVVENRSGEPLPTDWDLRLIYAGRTLRLDITLGQATISCLLDDQYQNALDGTLRGEANLYGQGQQGSRSQSSCRVTLR